MDARIRFTAEDATKGAVASVSAGIKRLDDEAGRLNKSMAAIGGATIVASLAGIANKAIETGAQIANLSEKFGLSAEQVSFLKFAAEQSDTSIEQLAAGIKKLSVNIVEAQDPASEQAAIFRDLGVSVKNADGSYRNVNDILGDVSEAFANMPDGVLKTALAVKLFGKNGADLLPFLNNGRAGLAELRAEFERLGLSIGEEQTAKLKNFEDATKRLSAAWTRFLVVIGTPVAEAGIKAVVYVKGLLDALGKTIGGVSAAIAAAARGNFSQAARIMDDLRADLRENAKNTFDEMAKLSQPSVEDPAAKKARTERLEAEQLFKEKLISVKTDETERLKRILAVQVDAYKQANSELEAARKQRLEIDADFKKLTADVTKGVSPTTGKISGNDISAQITQLQQASREASQLTGQDKADALQRVIEQAKEAGQALREFKRQQDAELQQTGSRSFNEGDFGLFAKQIGQVAGGAAAQQESDAQSRVDAIKAKIAEVAAQAQALQSLKVDFDIEGAGKSADALRALLEQKLAAQPIVIPVSLSQQIASGDLNLDKLTKPSPQPKVGQQTDGTGFILDDTILPKLLQSRTGQQNDGTGYILDDELFKKLQRKASGGPIAGPGPAGRDSVLMWGAPGEHVLTAEEVKAAGGHHMIYAMRAALRSGRLPGFAEGGAILSGVSSTLGAMSSPSTPKAAASSPVTFNFPGFGSFTLSGTKKQVKDVEDVFRLAALKRGNR